MIPFRFLLLPACLTLCVGQGEVQASPPTRAEVGEHVLRVPVIRPRITRPVHWTEKKGPRCIDSGKVLAATLAEKGSVDFHLRDRRRVRARMDAECPTLDFYGDLYLQPEDERICARRDEIRSRIGGSCRIERFRTMVPGRPK